MNEANGTTESACEATTPETLEQFVLAEGPLGERELAALPEASRRDYVQAQLRRVARLGREEYRRWVRRHNGSPEPEAQAVAPRPIDGRTLELIIDHLARRNFAGTAH